MLGSPHEQLWYLCGLSVSTNLLRFPDQSAGMSCLQDLMGGLQAALAGIDAPTGERAHSKCLANLRATIMAGRQVVNGMSGEQQEAACAMHQHWAEHNLRQPLKTVVELHKQLLV